MEFTREQYEAALDALSLDSTTTLSVNLSPHLVRVVHRDQAVTLAEVGQPEPSDS